MRRWALTLVLAALVPLCQAQLERRLGSYRAQEEVLYVSSGEVLRILTPGFESLLADIYWLRAVQYFGVAQSDPEVRSRLALLEPMIEMTVTLDPEFFPAYVLGGIFLAEPPPRGPGRPHAAVRLLERCVHKFPRYWTARQLLGVIIYLHLGDARHAAERLLEARKLEGAPFWLEGLGAFLLSAGGDREKSRYVWQQIAEQADLELVRQNALFNLRRLDALEAADELTRLAESFRTAKGRWPADGLELAGFVGRRLALADAEGVSFEYDASRGRFEMARSSPLWRPPDAFPRPEL